MQVRLRGSFPAPRDYGRLLADVQVDDAMSWHRFVAVRTMAPLGWKFGNLNWDQLVESIIGKSLLKAGYAPQTYDLSGELWCELARAADLSTPDELQFYLTKWGRCDSFVSQLLTGMRTAVASASDLGGWLADYMNTALGRAMGLVQEKVKYRVVDNAAYRTVASMTFASTLVDSPLAGRQPSPSAVRLGNICEILSWHAYEHDRPEYIIGLLYITMTRAIANDAQAVDSRQSAGDHVPYVAPPQPPPLAPSPQQAVESRPSAWTKTFQSDGLWVMTLVCRHCKREENTPGVRDWSDCFRRAEEMGWKKPSSRGWRNVRCPECGQWIVT